jgi:hypothetical protein
MKKRLLILGITVAAIAPAVGAQAATVVWGGGNGTFGTAANWVGGVAPGASDTASFGGWAPLDRSAWAVTASATGGTDVASNAIDGRRSTRWSTGTNQATVPVQTFKIDMGSVQTFQQITIDATGSTGDYPRGFDIYASNIDGSYGAPIASGAGSAALVTVVLATAQTKRWIKIQLNVPFGSWWSIGEINVYGTTGATQLSRSGWVASGNVGSLTPANAIDGDTTTRWTTNAAQASGAGQFFEIDMGTAQTFTAISLDAYGSTGDYPAGYSVSVSNDGSSWSAAVATGTPTAEYNFITFAAQTARYIKVSQTGTAGAWWSLYEFYVYGTPANCNIAANLSITAMRLDNAVTVTQASGVTVTLSGNYSQSAGTFTGGDSAMSVSGFTLSGGAFTSTTNTLTASGTFNQSGGTFTTAAGAVTCSSTGVVATVGGSYTVGSGVHTFSGGLTVQAAGTLNLATSGGTVKVGSGKTLIVDGTLNASSTGAAIQTAGAAGTTYTFTVGSTATATPTLDITGLQVKNTDTNGMYINFNTSSVTTFTHFDNIAFSAGSGNSLLNIYAKTLYLTSKGCSFDGGVASGSTTYNVKLVGNGNADSTETRAIFGGATCATDKTPCVNFKQDNDASRTGTGSAPTTDGGVVQFVTSAQNDLVGTIIGFPTAAINWNTFAYYSTYVAFHDANGTADRVYVRDNTGAAKYYWETTSGDTIIGTPRWDTVGATHYLYVATTLGKVYRLIDTPGSSTLVPDAVAPWSGTAFDCACTITTPLTLDTNNVYWAGITTVGTNNKLWTLGRNTKTLANGMAISTSSAVNNTAPTLWTGTSSYIYLGMTGRVSKVDVTAQAFVADNTNPGGSNNVTGRISVANNKLFVGDDNGNMWALDPDTNFGATLGTYMFWNYHDSVNHPSCGGVCGIQAQLVDTLNTRVYFGDQDGHVYVLNSTTGALITGYPFTTGNTGDAFQTAPLYRNGVIVMGTTTGTLYVIDRNSNGSVPNIIQTYKFGPTVQVSGIGYDSTLGAYLVSTADPSVKAGKLYYISATTDPTPSFP